MGYGPVFGQYGDGGQNEADANKGHWERDPQTGQQHWVPPVGPGGYSAGEDQLGKVTSQFGTEWGGYSGTRVSDGNGGTVVDPTLNGRKRDVDRLRGLAGAAADRNAYQLNYGLANGAAYMGQADRAGQSDAIGLARAAALGGPSAAQGLGASMLQQGADAQRATAMSARGGSLAQAAAMQQQQAGQGAYMQQGRNQLAALRADEMATGRSQWAAGATNQRQLDAQAQGLSQSQAEHQADMENAQRQLNQQGQLGYDQMAQNVNIAASRAALAQRETQVGIDGAASARASRIADHAQQLIGAGIGAGGALLAASDYRSKQNVVPVGLAATAMTYRRR